MANEFRLDLKSAFDIKPPASSNMKLSLWTAPDCMVCAFFQFICTNFLVNIALQSFYLPHVFKGVWCFYAFLILRVFF